MAIRIDFPFDINTRRLTVEKLTPDMKQWFADQINDERYDAPTLGSYFGLKPKTLNKYASKSRKGIYASLEIQSSHITPNIYYHEKEALLRTILTCCCLVKPFL